MSTRSTSARRWEQVVGHAAFEQPVVDEPDALQQDEVGEPLGVQGVGVDEREWDVSVEPGVQ